MTNYVLFLLKSIALTFVSFAITVQISITLAVLTYVPSWLPEQYAVSTFFALFWLVLVTAFYFSERTTIKIVSND